MITWFLSSSWNSNVMCPWEVKQELHINSYIKSELSFYRCDMKTLVSCAKNNTAMSLVLLWKILNCYDLWSTKISNLRLICNIKLFVNPRFEGNISLLVSNSLLWWRIKSQLLFARANHHKILSVLRCNLWIFCTTDDIPICQDCNQ